MATKTKANEKEPPPSATNPLFSVTFDVNSNDNYNDFIAGLRHRLGNPGKFSRNRPVLPPVEADDKHPPRKWFHVVLKTQSSALSLATRADNLYLEGFQSRDGTWWELTRGLIPGATYLGFGGSYPDLLGDKELTGVFLGPEQMTGAVNTLAARVPADLNSGAAQEEARAALPVLLLMVHEATRFAAVSGLVAGMMHPRSAKKKGRITDQMKAQVNGWQDLSKALMKADLLKPPGPFTPFPNMGISTVEEAAATVGILLFVDVKAKEKEKPPPATASGRSVGANKK